MDDRQRELARRVAEAVLAGASREEIQAIIARWREEQSRVD